MKKIFASFFIIFFVQSFLYKSLAQEKDLSHFVSAKEYIKIDSLNLALVELDTAIALAPSFANNYTLKGKVLEMKKEYRKAVDQYSLAILYNPTDTKLYLKRASLYFKLKDHRDYLLNDINKAIELKPTNSSLQELKAFYYAHTLNTKSLKPDYKNAIIALDKAILMSPTNARYYKNRSDYKIKNKQKLSALVDINKAISMDETNASFHHQRAIIKFVMEDFRSSLNDINQAIDINKNAIDYYQLRGNVYFNLARYEQAYKDYSVAINLIFNQIVQTHSTIKPSSPLNLKLRQILLLRGVSLVHGNKPYDGCSDFDKALKMGERKARNYIIQYCN